jgi:thiosulfate/3-mercaptopyruvate sulfurtransferase
MTIGIPREANMAARSALVVAHMLIVSALPLLAGMARAATSPVGSADSPGFAHPDSLDAGAPDLALLEVRELDTHRDSWTVLDARPADAFRDGHLPGARSFTWEDYTKTDERGVPYKTWPPQDLASALGAMGIDEQTPILVYGDADKSWGGEGWACWSLAWIGHRGPIRLLAGGIQAWQAAGLPLEAGTPTLSPPAARYQARPRPEINIETAELRGNSSALSIVDTRSLKEWLLGKIPGAIHIPWDEFHSGSDRRPISPDEMRELLRKKGVNTDRPVVYYCTGGIRSAYAWLVHELSGLPPARNYEGGMEEWKRVK